MFFEDQQFLYTNVSLTLETDFSDVQMQSDGDGYRYDFSFLAPELKPRFLSTYGGQMNYEKQTVHSLRLHDFSFYSNLIDTEIKTGKFDASRGFVKEINSIFSNNRHDYTQYVQFENDASKPSLSDAIPIDPDRLPHSFVPVKHFFSNVFIKAVQNCYSESGSVLHLHFCNLKIDGEDHLAIKVEGNGRTGYYNLSYRRPRLLGIALL